ncbi:MAG: threonylcarbamoyl-AMP synthase [Acidobacteria bacterium]|nr:MAG: threonylcarbamoyl-AMP synthase [Acidobacteriota bacterium]
MRASIERVTGGAGDDAALARAASLIRRGELVAFPTETVYGLGANALDESAVEKIFAAKGRPFADPLIVHLASADDVASVTASIPPGCRELMRAFWPGPLTLIMPRGAAVPRRVTAGRDTVAVRVPAHPVAQALLARAGVPIAAPSANRFSRPSPTTAAHVADDLGEALDLILDGGPTRHGVESTVLDLTSDPPVVLRPGAVTLEALREFVPGVAVTAEFETTRPYAAEKSPGTSMKHYSPNAEVRLWTGEAGEARAAMRHDAGQAIAAGRRVGALIVDEDAPAFDGLDVTLWRLGSERALDVVAARLYDGLRALDRARVDVILARDPGRTGLALTIRDRLFRAAEGRVLDSRR